MDWLDLLAVQGTLKSILQHHSSKALILWCSAFFTVQLSHAYMTTGKTIASTRWTFVGKVMSLLLNMLSRLVMGLPWWLRGESICLQCERPGFDPWVGKISWRRKWQPTPVLLPGESHGRRSLVDYSPRGCKESDTTERLHLSSILQTVYYRVTKENY